jgi:hypothetical protein
MIYIISTIPATSFHLLAIYSVVFCCNAPAVVLYGKGIRKSDRSLALIVLPGVSDQGRHTVQVAASLRDLSDWLLLLTQGIAMLCC